MSGLKEFINEEKKHVDSNYFSFKLFLEYCNGNSFVKTEKLGIDGDNNIFDLQKIMAALKNINNKENDNI